MAAGLPSRRAPTGHTQCGELRRDFGTLALCGHNDCRRRATVVAAGLP
jgi:hypothetical protein